MRFVGSCSRHVFDDAAGKADENSRKGQCHERCADIKYRVEHRQLELRSGREEVLEDRSERTRTTSDNTEKESDE